MIALSIIGFWLSTVVVVPIHSSPGVQPKQLIIPRESLIALLAMDADSLTILDRCPVQLVGTPQGDLTDSTGWAVIPSDVPAQLRLRAGTAWHRHSLTEIILLSETGPSLIGPVLLKRMNRAEFSASRGYYVGSPTSDSPLDSIRRSIRNPLPSSAQSFQIPAEANLCVLVLDGVSGKLLRGTPVQIMGTTMGGITDSLGWAVIENVPVGVHTLGVRMIGYEPLIAPAIRIAKDSITVVAPVLL